MYRYRRIDTHKATASKKTEDSAVLASSLPCFRFLTEATATLAGEHCVEVGPTARSFSVKELRRGQRGPRVSVAPLLPASHWSRRHAGRGASGGLEGGRATRLAPSPGFAPPSEELDGGSGSKEASLPCAPVHGRG